MVPLHLRMTPPPFSHALPDRSRLTGMRFIEALGFAVIGILRIGGQGGILGEVDGGGVGLAGGHCKGNPSENGRCDCEGGGGDFTRCHGESNHRVRGATL